MNYVIPKCKLSVFSGVFPPPPPPLFFFFFSNSFVVTALNVLLQRKPPIKVNNLFEEIKDGVVLLSLLEVLSGDKLVSASSASPVLLSLLFVPGHGFARMYC